MDSIEVIAQSFEHVHEAMREDFMDLPPRDTWWQAREGANHIGFLFWHLVRDEDVVVSHVCGLEQLWLSDGWPERLGLPADEQGTGTTASAVNAVRYDLAAFMDYAAAVWRRTPPAIRKLSEGRLDEAAWPGSDWSVMQQLVEGCLAHSWLHLGEIRFIRGLRGWRFRE